MSLLLEKAQDRSLKQVALFETRSLPDAIDKLSFLEDDTPVLWFDGERSLACEGAWLRTGRFSLKYGSFIDPSDLSVYGRQYYELGGENGRHHALQVGYSLDVPEGATFLEAFGDAKGLMKELGTVNPSIKLLQPSESFEMHGRLTQGWSMRIFEIDDIREDKVLVFG